MTSRIVAPPGAICLLLSGFVLSTGGSPLSAQVPVEDWPPASTFSILGYDPATGEVGGAVQSRVFSIGNRNLWAEADVGVVATQAVIDVSYGPKGLELLGQGLAPESVLVQLLAQDPDPLP